MNFGCLLSDIVKQLQNTLLRVCVSIMLETLIIPISSRGKLAKDKRYLKKVDSNSRDWMCVSSACEQQGK